MNTSLETTIDDDVTTTPGAASEATPEANNPRSLSLPVEGMTCASCVARVEKVLGALDGVENASVNLTTEKASINFDPAVIAEGVETQEQIDMLRDYGCDQIQGYLFCPPMPATELTKFLLEKNTAAQ